MPYKNISEQEIMTREGKIKLKPGATIYTAEEKENFKRMKENESFREQIHIDSHNHGGFTFLKKVNDAMEKMKPETVGRLVYLSTYLDFGSKQLMAEANRPMKKSDLQYFLKIGETKVRHFCDECISHGLLTIDENKLLYLDDIFFKGKSSQKENIKLYCKTIRDLYKRMPARHHRYFGYIIQLLPYISIEWNVICKNPEEKDSKKVCLLTVKEMCELLNYSTNQSCRFQNAITHCMFEWDGRLTSMCGTVSTSFQDGDKVGLIVNPHLVFYGTDFKKVEGIGIFFTPHEKENL